MLLKGTMVYTAVHHVKNASFTRYVCIDGLEMAYYLIEGSVPHMFQVRVSKDLDHCTCQLFVKNFEANLFNSYQCDHILAMGIIMVFVGKVNDRIIKGGNLVNHGAGGNDVSMNLGSGIVKNFLEVALDRKEFSRNLWGFANCLN
jgi:hypothetical protein